MASPVSLMAIENFCCSICLEVFTKPVSIPCGHTFCLACITQHWDTVKTLMSCPLCKEEFYTKPMLRVNVFIAEMAEKFKHAVQKQSSSTREQAGPEKVLCNHCTEPRSAAVKSCFVCFTSFCQTHLEPHMKISVLKKHKLIDPVANLENRLCKIHDEPLEFFCRVDQMYLCESCKNEEHKTHRMVTLEEEAQERKKQLAMEKERMDQMTQARQQKYLEIQCSLDASRSNAKEALACSSHMVAVVEDYLRRSQTELTEVINAKLKQKEKEARDYINELEAETMEIQLKKMQLDNISLTDDSFTFLENVLPLTVSSPQVKDLSDVTLSTDQFAVQEALAELETSITTKISKLCDPTFKEKQLHAVDVTFDPETANSSLYVFDDGRKVSYETKKRQVQNKPERFDQVLNVLAKEGFSSGKFYYEVQVKNKTQWDLGVASESINRKGDIRLSPKYGYWTIWLRKGDTLTANVSPHVNLHVTEIPQKVGIFVDYDEGEVSFYDVDARANIFSFTGCTFTGKLFPFFSPCNNDGGKNSAPLIITPVTHN